MSSRPSGINSFTHKPSTVSGTSSGLIGDGGEVTVASPDEFLLHYMEEIDPFIARVLSVLPQDAWPQES
ncbi:hypothetical protein J7643_02125 [bacterium]|nr:hypothetical protein [bacterium]